jgi:trk system potassium uptake protein TrkH
MVEMSRTTRAGESLALVPVIHIIGWFVTALGLLMIVPALVDGAYGNPDWKVFSVSAGVSTFAGIALLLTTSGARLHLSIRQGFMLTTGVWLCASVAGSLPLMFSGLGMNFTDAFFETMSGLTTTGSTVLVGLDTAPPGILLWRGLLQWIGGIGFIAVGLAMLPFLQIGGMQLFRLESSEKADKAVPQAGRFAALLLTVYLGLTLACLIALHLAGMTWLEASVHAMTTLSTGGYSTSDNSVGYFRSASVEWIITVFMLAGSLPFLLYVRAVQGRGRFFLLRDEQVQSFLRFVVAVSIGLGFWLWFAQDVAWADALRLATFNVVSVVTTTGYASTDYTQWGNLAQVVFFLLTFVGGCTGSTAGGLKAFRFDILGLALKVYIQRLIFPHGAFAATYNGRTVAADVVAGVLLFMGLYLITAAVVSVLLAMTGLDLVTCVSGAATALGNVGPGLGPIIGPAGNFSSLPDTAKWLLSTAMLLGRLEFFTVLALFSPRFWRH